MKRRIEIVTVVLITVVCSTTTLYAQPRTRSVRRTSNPPVVGNGSNPGSPLPGLTSDQLSDFLSGLEDFREIETIDDGLGPVFNGRSCSECHRDPGIGGDSPRLVTRIGTETLGEFDPLVQFGGSLLQNQAIGRRDGSLHDFRPEIVPPEATIVTPRRTPPLFGFGFVDVTPDQTFIALAQEQAVLQPETAGRVNFVMNIPKGMTTVGKFGWKSQVPSLEQFAGDAYLNEMEITNPIFPDENCPSGNCAELAFNPRPDLNDLGGGVRALTDFMVMLAPLNRIQVNTDPREGESVFNRIGCQNCHVATLRTGRSDIASLDNREYHPYSDFLLHDMGPLGDGIEQGNARGTEMRTAPLWGLHAARTFLHDGRARSIEEAILAHDGQGLASKRDFERLDRRSRDQLLGFLRSL